MKKVLMTLLLAASMVACEKEISTNNDNASTTKEASTSETKSSFELGKKYSGTIEEMVVATGKVTEKEVLVVSQGEEENLYHWTYYSSSDKSVNGVTEKVVVCRGIEMGYARCCKRYYDQGKCLAHRLVNGQGLMEARLIKCPQD